MQKRVAAYLTTLKQRQAKHLPPVIWVIQIDFEAWRISPKTTRFCTEECRYFCLSTYPLSLINKWKLKLTRVQLQLPMRWRLHLSKSFRIRNVLVSKLVVRKFPTVVIFILVISSTILLMNRIQCFYPISRAFEGFLEIGKLLYLARTKFDARPFPEHSKTKKWTAKCGLFGWPLPSGKAVTTIFFEVFSKNLYSLIKIETG